MAKQPKKFDHLMIDLETMGNKSYSSIISIAALEFDINTGNTGKEFYKAVSLESCMVNGLLPNADTIMWWMQQNEEARLELVNAEKVSIYEALLDFAGLFSKQDYQVWGNSARFDLGLLENAFHGLHMDIPWKFYNERCVRTLAAFKPDIKKKICDEHVGVAHNALHDCYKQVAYCSTIWNTLNK
jgi:DNA polymerase III epsilon subunit-like protein